MCGPTAATAGLALLAMTAVLGLPRRAEACSCVTPKPFPRDALRNADAVFEGRAYGHATAGLKARYSFDVDRFWKGELGQRVEIETHTHSAACGRGYELGRSYIIYARRSGTHWVDNMCSRTRPTVAAAEDLLVLGDGTRPGQGTVDFEPAAAIATPPLEPPRIVSGPQPIAPAPPSGKRGCTIDSPGSAAAVALLLGVALFRRRND